MSLGNDDILLGFIPEEEGLRLNAPTAARDYLLCHDHS